MKFRVTKISRESGRSVCAREVSGKMILTAQDAREAFAARSGVTLETLERDWVLDVRGCDDVNKDRVYSVGELVRRLELRY